MKKLNLTYGVGFNSKGKYKATANGKVTREYAMWVNMLQRCYYKKTKTANPTYADCTVDEHWHNFQNFAHWYHTAPFSNMGYDLDKDILFPGNKIYGPKFCCFVPRKINNLRHDQKAIRGKYPQGVAPRSGRYSARGRVVAGNTRGKRIGMFDTIEEAYNAYKEAKERHVKNTALKWANAIQWEVFKTLMLWELPEYKELKS